MERNIVILLTLVAYMVALLVIGVIAQRRTRSETDFFLGGRKLGPLLAAVGASASSSSAWTLLGVSGAAYAWGVSAVWLFPACVGGFCLNWFLIAPAMQRHSHRTGAMTMIEAIAGPRGSDLRRAVVAVAAVVVLVSLGAYVASQFNAAGKILGDVFGVPAWVAILIGAAVILGYTMVGGFWAVSITDTLQGLMMAATSIVLPIGALVAVGGFGDLATQLQAVQIDGYASLGGPRTPVMALGFVVGLLGIGLGYPGQPHVVKYFMAMGDGERVVARARLIAIAWAVVIYSGMILLGLCGRTLFAELADKENIFSRATLELFHPVVGGVMLAAVLSAMMSTADSQLLVASSTVAHDVGGASESRTLVRSRLTVVLLTAAGVVVALVGSQEIFSQVLFGWGAMGAAFGPLLIVRVVMGRELSGARTLFAMSVGFLLSVGAFYFHKPLFDEGNWHLFTRGVVPFAAALAIAIWPSRMTRSEA